MHSLLDQPLLSISYSEHHPHSPIHELLSLHPITRDQPNAFSFELLPFLGVRHLLPTPQVLTKSRLVAQPNPLLLLDPNSILRLYD